MQTSNEIYNVSSGTKLKCGSVFCSIYHYLKEKHVKEGYAEGGIIQEWLTKEAPGSVDFNIGQTSLPQTLCKRPTNFEISESLRYWSLSI